VCVQGYHELVINRIHHATKKLWRQKDQQHLEFVWRTSSGASTPGDDEAAAIPGLGDMFTHVLYKHYSAPKVCQAMRHRSLSGTRCGGVTGVCLCVGATTGIRL